MTVTLCKVGAGQGLEMTVFAIVCVSAVIVARVTVDIVKRLRRDADLRRRWHDRPTRRGRPSWRQSDRLA